MEQKVKKAKNMQSVYIFLDILKKYISQNITSSQILKKIHFTKYMPDCSTHFFTNSKKIYFTKYMNDCSYTLLTNRKYNIKLMNNHYDTII